MQIVVPSEQIRAISTRTRSLYLSLRGQFLQVIECGIQGERFFHLLLEVTPKSGRFLLDAVAVHVDGFEDALGEVLLLRRRQLGSQQREQDWQLLPLIVAIRNHRREEAVSEAEHLGVALEGHLAVLV